MTAVSEEPAWRQRTVSDQDRAAKLRAEQRVQRFLDSAQELIVEKGTTDFTVQEVVNRSKQSLRSFYQHFDGKHELLLALFEDALSVGAAKVREAAATESDPLQRLRIAVETLYEQSHPSPGVQRPLLNDFALQLLVSTPSRWRPPTSRCSRSSPRSSSRPPRPVSSPAGNPASGRSRHADGHVRLAGPRRPRRQPRPPGDLPRRSGSCLLGRHLGRSGHGGQVRLRVTRVRPPDSPAGEFPFSLSESMVLATVPEDQGVPMTVQTDTQASLPGRPMGQRQLTQIAAPGRCMAKPVPEAPAGVDQPGTFPVHLVAQTGDELLDRVGATLAPHDGRSAPWTAPARR